MKINITSLIDTLFIFSSETYGKKNKVFKTLGEKFILLDHHPEMLKSWIIWSSIPCINVEWKPLLFIFSWASEWAHGFQHKLHINKGSQLSQSSRHVTPSASSCWNIPNHGMFKEHPHPVKTSNVKVARFYCPIAASFFQGAVSSFLWFGTALEEENTWRGS